jgi:SprT-like protein
MIQRTDIDFQPEKLLTLANKLSQHFWKKECTIPVVWNGRLKKAMGRFLFSYQGKKRIPVRIEMSKHAAQFINREIFIAVLLHELCHYHLFIQGHPFDDHHPLFEKELGRVGAISTNTVQIPQKGFELICSQCQQTIGTRRRMNTSRYLSGCCKAKIAKKEVLLGTFKYGGKILNDSKVTFSQRYIKNSN